MKKILLMLVTLCFVSVTHADVTVDVDPSAAWNGYVTVFDTPGNGGGYQWGSPWGTSDLRANFGEDLFLQANSNTYDDGPTDVYWVDQGTLLGNKTLQANIYQELAGLSGQNLTFNFTVLSNNLAAAGYETQAFIKVLDTSSGYATVQSVYADLDGILDTLSLLESGAATTPLFQAGFVVTGINVAAASINGGLGVHVQTVPEPVSMSLLGLGSMAMLRRRKKIIT